MLEFKVETICSHFFTKIFAKTAEISGISSCITKSTLVDANRERYWRIMLIMRRSYKKASPLYLNDNKLYTIIYAFNSTTIDL